MKSEKELEELAESLWREISDLSVDKQPTLIIAKVAQLNTILWALDKPGILK